METGWEKQGTGNVPPSSTLGAQNTATESHRGVDHVKRYLGYDFWCKGGRQDRYQSPSQTLGKRGRRQHREGAPSPPCTAPAVLLSH